MCVRARVFVCVYGCVCVWPRILYLCDEVVCAFVTVRVCVCVCVCVAERVCVFVWPRTAVSLR